MDYLINNYISACKAEVFRFGFKQKRNTFVRIVNDVMQNFLIEKIFSGRACRIEFAIIPLCMRIEKDYILGGVYTHCLKRFEVISGTPLDFWKYDKNSKISMDVCLKDIIRHITNYLLPFYDQAVSCKTALPELIKLENIFDNNRMTYLKIHDIEDHANPYTNKNLLDSTKYFMSLKNGDYDFAIKSCQAILQQNIYSYTKAFKLGYLTEKNKLEKKERIEKLRSEIIRLEEGDKTFFQKMIIENEAYSNEVLNKFL